MKRGRGAAVCAMVSIGWALAWPTQSFAGPVTRAGVAVSDATWHVGASAGQYAGDPLLDDQDPTPILLGSHGWDPFYHHVRRSPSYGIQSRLTARALVIEGPDGERLALVKNDLYIPQDILWRRTAELVEAKNVGIDRGHVTMMVTHNHSSPYYPSTSWGPWAFQDSFDLRFFEYYAQRMADAVEQAAKQLVPVRMGAAVSYFDKTHRHAFGPQVADDGTPAGYPHSDNDHDMMVVRFDDVTDPGAPRPLAILGNFGVHPEFLEGNDLNSADYVGPLERMVGRETGAVLVWSQGSVGTAEPERSTYHSIHERLEFTHRDYAQAERGARLMADKLIETWNDIEAGAPEQPGRFLALTENVPVKMVDRFFPGPLSHPYPGVSNCRTDTTLGGAPQLPIVGLPDCEKVPIADTGLSTDDFERLGIPVPENYSAPSYTGLEETLSVHLQAIQLGDLLITICPGEQWADQTRNVKTRTDRVPNNAWIGFDWSPQCTQNADGTWTCPDPRSPAQSLPPISDLLYRRMKAQVNNDAAGWNDPSYLPWAESEPVDPAAIKGNYTHTELPVDGTVPGHGYGMTLTIGQANDYLGYIATYREYQRGDHYRKALTGYGAHFSDYVATRLVQLGGFLNGGADAGDASDAALAPKTAADQATADARATAFGTAADAAVPAYEAALPNDGGSARVVEQPADIERFSAAFFTWVGGSNWSDDPRVRVERQTGTDAATGAPIWTEFADMSGELPVTLELPTDILSGAMPFLLAQFEWRWTAHFEAFDSDLADLGARPGQTPAGLYRFVVDGSRREGGGKSPYHLESQPFAVKPWTGIVVEDILVEADGRVSFTVGPTTDLTAEQVAAAGCAAVPARIGPIDYPDSYDGLPQHARFIRNRRSCTADPADPQNPALFEWYCTTCSFRPWADTGSVASAMVTILPANGGASQAAALLEADGRWRTAATLAPGDGAYVAAGGVVDENGETNGSPSAEVAG